jgi:tetratricopeptide (TPR) repeat protein
MIRVLLCSLAASAILLPADDEPERLRETFEQCRRLSAAGQRLQAERTLTAALSDEAHFGEVSRALIHNRLGTFYFEEGKLLRSQHHHELTLTALEKYRVEYEPLVMRIAVNLASSYLEAGQVSKAEKLALKFARCETARTGIADTGRLFSLLGSIASHREDDREAERYYRRAKAIFDPMSNEEEGESKAMLLANLARLLGRTGRLAEAAGYAKESMTALAASPAPSPASTIAVLREAARVFAALGRPGEARPLLQRAIAVSESAFGESHGLRAGLLVDWAAVLRAQNRGRDARTLERRASSIRAQSQSENLLGYTVDARSLTR